ncbi:MAG TPA: prolyl oligopeptidase family serine peptidase, partial [Thermomicrobiales bacterium]|nr:prolyl oligopeptidase family serine peptidase [Thermomicrobiales bacterium]
MIPSRSQRSFDRRAALKVGAGLAAAASGLPSAAARAAQPATPVATPTATDPVARAVPHVFADDDFEFQFLIALGQTYERAADVGECFAVAAAIPDGDADAWFDAFFALAERIRPAAEASDAAGQTTSARDAYLRAATYYAQASFFADATRDPARLIPTWEAQRAAFDAFAARLDPPAEPVQIPYEGVTLPGYALTVDASGAPRPWVIMNNGSDGTASDMWSQGAAAALRRGYNALIFDGPGQGAALYRQGLVFRPDWENVIRPVVDWLLTRGDVDPTRIAIIGVSQGGYWVPRAVAFERRIAAAIADPGVMDVATIYNQYIPPDALQALMSATGDELTQIANEIDQGAAAEAAKNPRLAFTLAFRLRPYGTSSFAQALRLVNAYNLRGVVGQ